MIDRIAPTRRPDRFVAAYQSWRALLFVHWEVPADALRPLLPSELDVDTYDGRAFVGLVPFTVAANRPRFLPPIPGSARFHETNVRTYVHHRGRDPGVWFFSLDAARTLPVIGARAVTLRYFRARMDMRQDGRTFDYASERLWPGPRPATLRARWTTHDEAPHVAVAGTLEHFLVERYVLYTQALGSPLLRGRVHHRPYPLVGATLEALDESLVSAAGIARTGAPCSVLFSDGVDVEIFAFDVVRS